MRPIGAPGVALPRWVYLPAALGTLFVVVPLVGMAVKVDWSRFGALITSPDSRAALVLSLRTATMSTLLCLILGVPLALVLARHGGRLARVVRPLILVPLVLPPVVGGLALLYVFGRLGLLGHYLEAAGIRIAFTTAAVVLAQTFVSLPFLVIALEGSARTAGRDYDVVAATLGARPATVWWRVTLPLLTPGLIAGSVLAFARALGEFGATITFAGNFPGRTQTMPLATYLALERDPDDALLISLVLIAVSLVVLLGLRDRWLGTGREIAR